MKNKGYEIYIEERHINDRAYFIYIERIENNLEGDHISDWLQAVNEFAENSYLFMSNDFLSSKESGEGKDDKAKAGTKRSSTKAVKKASNEASTKGTLSRSTAKSSAKSPAKKRPKKDKNTDLTLINGIGKVISESLNNEGIYKITEFAKLSKKEIEDFAEKYEYTGIYTKYEWLSDAVRLVKKHNLS